MILAALLQTFGGFVDPTHHVGFGWVIAFAIGLSVSARVTLWIWKWDQRWYGTRAAAENMKSHCWYYMMGVNPAAGNGNALTETDFEEDIGAIADDVSKWLPRGERTAPQRCAATAQMSTALGSTVPERAARYRANRVEDQIGFYGAKARLNRRRHRLLWWLVLVLEAAVLAFAILTVRVSFQFTVAMSVPLTAAAALTAWNAAKRHRDLADSYARTADALRWIGRQLALQLDPPGDETVLGQLVDALEQLLSQENALWAIRSGGGNAAPQPGPATAPMP